MNVILDTADGNCGHANVASDSANEGPSAVLEIVWDSEVTALGREDAMNAQGDAIMAHALESNTRMRECGGRAEGKCRFLVPNPGRLVVGEFCRPCGTRRSIYMVDPALTCRAGFCCTEGLIHSSCGGIRVFAL